MGVFFLVFAFIFLLPSSAYSACECENAVCLEDYPNASYNTRPSNPTPYTPHPWGAYVDGGGDYIIEDCNYNFSITNNSTLHLVNPENINITVNGASTMYIDADSRTELKLTLNTNGTVVLCGAGPYVLDISRIQGTILICEGTEVIIDAKGAEVQSEISAKIYNRGSLTIEGNFNFTGARLVNMNELHVTGNMIPTDNPSANFTNRGTAKIDGKFGEFRAGTVCLAEGSLVDAGSLGTKNSSQNCIIGENGEGAGGCLHFGGDAGALPGNNVPSCSFVNKGNVQICQAYANSHWDESKWGTDAIKEDCPYCSIVLKPVNVNFCDGDDLTQPVELKVIVNGGKPGYIVTWAEPLGACSTTGQGGTARPFTCTADAPAGGWSGITSFPVSVEDEDGNIASVEVKVIVNPKPVITVISPAPVCDPNTVSIAGTADGALTYKYYTTADGTTEFSNTTISGVGTTDYWVVGYDANGCESDRVQGTVTINPQPDKPITTPISLCVGDPSPSITDNVTSLDDHSLVWYTMATGGAGSATPPSISTSATGTTTYYVSQRNTETTCESDRTPITVTVNDKPVVSLPVVSACAGDNTDVTPAINNNGSEITGYVWTFDGGTIASGTGLPGVLSYSFSTSGTLTLEVTNECGMTSASTTVSVTQKPTLSVVAPANICSGETFNVTLNSNPTDAVKTWTVISETDASGASGGSTTGNSFGQSLTATGTTPGTVVYRVTPSSGICLGDPETFTVTVNPKPQVEPHETVCNKDGSFTLTQTPAGMPGTWSSNNTSIATIDNSGSVSILSGQSGNVTFTFTSTAGCSDETTVNITSLCGIEPLRKTDECPEDDARKLRPTDDDQICFKFKAFPINENSTYTIYDANNGTPIATYTLDNLGLSATGGESEICVAGDKIQAINPETDSVFYSVWIDENKVVILPETYDTTIVTKVESVCSGVMPGTGLNWASSELNCTTKITITDTTQIHSAKIALAVSSPTNISFVPVIGSSCTGNLYTASIEASSSWSPSNAHIAMVTFNDCVLLPGTYDIGITNVIGLSSFIYANRSQNNGVFIPIQGTCSDKALPPSISGGCNNGNFPFYDIDYSVISEKEKLKIDTIPGIDTNVSVGRSVELISSCPLCIKPEIPVTMPVILCAGATVPDITDYVTYDDVNNTLVWYPDLTQAALASAPVISNVNTGTTSSVTTYYVSQRRKNNSDCESDKTPITITVKPLPVCSITTDNAGSVCPNTSGLAYIAPSGMDAYLWEITGNGAITSGDNTQSATVTAGTCGIYTLVLTVKKDGCESQCSLSADVENPIPEISVGTYTSALGCNPTLPTQAEVESLFSVTDGCDASARASVTTTGATHTGCSYTQEWIATYSNACGQSAGAQTVTYTWTESQKPSITTLATPINYGRVTNAPTFRTDTLFSVVDNCAINPIVTVVDKGIIQNGCDYSRTFTAGYQSSCGVEADSVSITYKWINDIQPTITLSDAALAICGNQKVVLNAVATPAEAKVEWFDQDNAVIGTGETLTVNPSYIAVGGGHRTVYTYKVVASFCNREIFSIMTVNVDEPLTGEIIGDRSICEGSTTTLDASSYDADSYTWTSDEDFTGIRGGASLIVKPAHTSTYSMNMSRGACNNIEDEFTVEVTSLPQIAYIDSIGILDREIIPDDYFGTPPYYYGLDNEDANEFSVKYNLELGSHVFYIVDALGCRSEMEYTVKAPMLIFPSYFTPDGDNINDTWEVIGLKELYPDAVVKIFDRFGKKLIEYKGSDVGWDGTYLGRDMPATDYWYLVYAKGFSREISGHFTLLRSK